MDRRKFQRVGVPVFCKPVGQPLFGRRKAVDVSLGGLRIYADDPPQAGDVLTYRCEDCADRWDLVVDEDDLDDGDRP